VSLRGKTDRRVAWGGGRSVGEKKKKNKGEKEGKRKEVPNNIIKRTKSDGGLCMEKQQPQDAHAKEPAEFRLTKRRAGE